MLTGKDQAHQHMRDFSNNNRPCHQSQRAEASGKVLRPGSGIMQLVVLLEVEMELQIEVVLVKESYRMRDYR